MTLLKKITLGIGVAILANTPMAGASDGPENKDTNAKQGFMNRSHELFKAAIEDLHQFSPAHTEMAFAATQGNAIPLLFGCTTPSKIKRYGFGAFTTIVPLYNTYLFYKFDTKMEALCPSEKEVGDFRKSYSRNNKPYHLLLGGSILGSTLATTFTRKPAFLFYTYLASCLQGATLSDAEYKLKFAEFDFKTQQRKEDKRQESYTAMRASQGTDTKS